MKKNNNKNSKHKTEQRNTHKTNKQSLSQKNDSNAVIRFVKKVLFSPVFQLMLRLILGITFISASIDKLLHPRLFAEVIYNYQILPVFLVNLAAAVMPILEFAAGITLIIGFWTRSSSFILSGLTLIFIAAISFNMIRGLEVSCGCFDVISGSKIGADLLIRDILLLIAGVLIIADRRPKIGIDQLLNRNK